MAVCDPISVVVVSKHTHDTVFYFSGSLHGKIAASVLLKLFTSGNKR